MTQKYVGGPTVKLVVRPEVGRPTQDLHACFPEARFFSLGMEPAPS